MGRPAKFTQAQVAEALRETRGMVSLAADRLQCSQQSVRNYIERYPALTGVLADQRERMTDVAELKLAQAIQNGDAWAVCFYLKTQGKSRGYVERSEVTGAGGGPVALTITVVEDRHEQPAPAIDIVDAPRALRAGT